MTGDHRSMSRFTDQPQKHNLPGIGEHMMMRPIIRHWAQTSLMDARLSEYQDHGSTVCAPRQKQAHVAHMFSRLTSPIVTANVKILSRKIVALFIDSGYAGGFPNSLTALLLRGVCCAAEEHSNDVLRHFW